MNEQRRARAFKTICQFANLVGPGADKNSADHVAKIKLLFLLCNWSLLTHGKLSVFFCFTQSLIKIEECKANSPQKERKITQYNLFYCFRGVPGTPPRKVPDKEKDKLPLFWKFRVPLHHLHDNATIGVEISQKTKL